MTREIFHRTVFLLAILAAAGLAGADGWFKANQTTLEVSEVKASLVRLNISAGEIRIEGVSGDTLSAQATMECRKETGRCANTAKKLAWSLDEDDETLRLRLRPSWGDFGDSKTLVVVQVPAERDLYFDIDAGDIDVLDMRSCVNGHVDAGDVTVTMAADQVASVHLDTDAGDASLRMNGKFIPGDRSWLVGAVVNWRGGQGDCDVDLSLNAGDLKLELF